MIDPYVVTPKLAVCFDRALTLIRDAVEKRQSTANFGRGKKGEDGPRFIFGPPKTDKSQLA
jgi:hypothetical protein